MEIEIKPISLEARLDYLNTISENQQSNTKKFPWAVATFSAFIDVSIVYAIIIFRSKKQKITHANSYPQQEDEYTLIQGMEQQAHNDNSSGMSLNISADNDEPSANISGWGW